VKTLLGRLVQKKAVAFEVEGRGYRYRPLLSELECIRLEMRALAAKIYGGRLRRKTAHFLFYGHRDLGLLAKLSETLESSLSRILRHLDIDLGERITVYLHDTLPRLHSALGVLDGPAWLRAGLSWDILHIGPAACFTDLRVEEAAVHILSQLLVCRINPGAPYWLVQGIAAFEGRWLDRRRLAIALAANRDWKSLLEVSDMRAGYLRFKEDRGYELACSAIQFMVSRFGFRRLVRFIKTPLAYDSVFGLSEAEFWEDWSAFIDEKYGRSGVDTEVRDEA
jgi:hypothetical protein